MALASGSEYSPSTWCSSAPPGAPEPFALQPFELAGATRVGPRTLKGEGSFPHTARPLDAEVCLIAIVHRNHGVAPVLSLRAGQISGDREGRRCRFQPGHLYRHARGTGGLFNYQLVAGLVAGLDGLQGVRLAAFAGAGNLILGQRRSGEGR